MIIEFSVSNFRSIYTKVTLNLQATKLTGKEASNTHYFTPDKYPQLPILKSAVVYGANASGKSNLLRAVEFFKNFVINSTDLKFGDPLPHAPFGLLKTALQEPSSFEMEFIAKDNIRYIYGFSFDRTDIIEEHLLSFTTRKPAEIFVRKKGESIRFSSSFKGPKKSLEDQLQNNHLLLSKAANSNFDQVHKIYSYFSDNINVFHSTYANNNLSKRSSFENDVYRNKINQFLKIADTGIESLEVVKEDKDYFSQLANNSWPITNSNPNSFYEHAAKLALDEPSYKANVVHYTSDEEKKEKVVWSLDEESAGTIKLFAIAGPIIDILNGGHVLIFDEINNSLHPLISEFIVRLFHNTNTNPHNAQLIFTTHDTTLLNKETFRRDQIWFLEKNKRGMSELFPLSSFDKKEVRWDVPFDKWYLSGRFGALPSVQDFKLDSK